VFLQCPECRLTVSASAYYLRDQCPRCRTTMEPRATVRDGPEPAAMPAARAVQSA